MRRRLSPEIPVETGGTSGGKTAPSAGGLGRCAGDSWLALLTIGFISPKVISEIASQGQPIRIWVGLKRVRTGPNGGEKRQSGPFGGLFAQLPSSNPRVKINAK